MEAVRKQIFTGCSGTVRVEPDTNNRFINFLVLKNALWNPATNSVQVSNAAYWNPTGSDVLTILQPLKYAGNTTIKPSDFRVVLNNCPFPEKEIRTFDKGRYLVFGICIAVAVATAGVTIVIWKKWWNIRAEDLKERKEISVPDAIMAATIVIEFFQLLAMGPDITPINSLISDIGKSFSLDFESLIQVRNDVFLIFLDVVFGSIILWVILSVIVLFRLDEIFNRVAIIRHLSSLSDYLMPVLGNLLFIPFMSGLLDVFVCDKSIGDDFTQSFMYKDCNQFCWENDHIIYVTFAFIGIILYEPLAIFCRPLWQEFQSLAHVKYSPRHLMLKTIFQITLIVMNKTVKRAQDIAHGAIFTFFVLVFAVFTHGHKAYNYPRFSWWLTLSLFGIVWESFLTTINIGIGNSDSLVWVFILIAGWGIIGIIGLWVQKKKYPSLLFRSKGKDTSNLFKFAFTLTRGKSKVISFK
ncbi:unnamed protein product [Blepharisma stoltei]|uniref:Uncharacterized protein n=1 Tax=Blepharisma stoltei TaxID=1481888 RepID=A0AAU9JWQ8_9CILI|nr:unnamed protein product [Blepharisma stoltei]